MKINSPLHENLLYQLYVIHHPLAQSRLNKRLWGLAGL
ncbi:hypothetical protein NBRC111894_2722 [Sporolactobacillus inulinus]|uniref:Uncharacterized protein n=1 Tax=Sporolactobacillus inulinus TaxID=2078 RepID=A0A4Y1ZFC0_9BACL|nr:hypothetical protein NBRC111894_2722 [Sporolactobacillus inulinus]